MPLMMRVQARRRKFFRKLHLESLEARQMMTAVPLGALPYDTGEFMLGRVAVTPVLLESNGQIDPSTEDWTPAEIEQVLGNVRTGMQWWVDTLEGLSTVHTLEFVIDDTFAITPVETPYEPITRQSNSYPLYVGQFLIDQGYDGLSLTLDDAMRDFNNSQREKLNTDWSFTIFIVDSSADADGMFDPTGDFRQAFAFAGGLFFVTPSTRPASTYAHETGHMFWARDEYPNSGSYNDRRGYYNTQNTNAIDDAPPGFQQEPSIMSSGLLLQQAYNNNVSAASTLAQIGWQDSNGNGIFDVLDIPLKLNLTTVYDAESQVLRMRGFASAVPLINRNSSGLQSDITLNKVSRIEYRIDGGSWQSALTPAAQAVDISLDLDLSVQLAGITPVSIELRAIDADLGITSNLVEVVPNRPSSGVVGVDGFAFVDDDHDSTWSGNEAFLPGVTLSIANTEGIFHGRLEPDDTANFVYSNPLPGLQIVAVGNHVDGRVGSFSGSPSTGAYNFHYASLFGAWGDSWTRVKQELSIQLEQATTHVSIMAIGKDVDSIARLEAYDVDGQLVTRTTSGALAIGESVTLRLFDPEGRIRSVRAFGTAGTSVSLDDFRYGPEVSATSSLFGTFNFSGLPDGTYTIEIESPSSQYVVIEEDLIVHVVNGVADPIVIGAIRATSPWTNPNNPLDVNGRDGVQPLDALIIINELNRSSPRLLTEQDSTPPYLDVNGDWSITPIDALRIINSLNRSGGVPGSGEGMGGWLGGSRAGASSGIGALAGDAGFFAGGAGLGEGEAIVVRDLKGDIDEENADHVFAESAWNLFDHQRTSLANAEVYGFDGYENKAALRLSGSTGLGAYLDGGRWSDWLYSFCVSCQL